MVCQADPEWLAHTLFNNTLRLYIISLWIQHTRPFLSYIPHPYIEFKVFFNQYIVILLF